MIAWDAVLARERPRLFALAYRVLGSAAQADDVLQDAFLRVRAEEEPRSPEALLTTVVTRLAIDALRRARRSREAYVGPWLPEPIQTEEAWSPYDDVARRDGARMGVLLLLERLTPLERAVLVLREVFDYEWDELALVVGRSPVACRKILQRAREHVGEEATRRRPVDDGLAAALLGALGARDVGAVERLLADGVVFTSDGGGQVRAARREVTGRDRVARMLVGLAEKQAPELGVLPLSVNGSPAVALVTATTLFGVLVLEGDGPRVTAVRFVASPAKLARLAGRLGLGPRAADPPPARGARGAPSVRER